MSKKERCPPRQPQRCELQIRDNSFHNSAFSIGTNDLNQELRKQGERRHPIYWIGPTVVAAAIGLAWIAGPSALRYIARSWVVSDSLVHADAIVVLGGNVGVRTAAAGELYKRGISPKVAVGISDFDQGQHGRLNRDVLLRGGVASSDIIEFNFQLHSTYGEARGILEWAKVSGAKTVIIPVDIFPTRRVRWIFNHELGPAGIRVIVHAVTPSSYSVDNWWRHQAGLINFRNELIKFAYYRLKY